MTRLCCIATAVFVTACVNSHPRDAGTNPDTVPPIDVSEWVGIVDSGTVRYWEEVGKAKRCEAADLDGDGTRELLCLRSEDGTTTLIKEGNGPLEWKVEHFADGRIRYTYWYKTSLQPDLVDEKFPDGRRTMLFDRDHDRKFEQRRDEELDGGDIVVTLYVDAGTTWASTRGWVQPASSDQNGMPICNGNSNFPSERGWWQGGNPAAFSENSNVRCTPAERSKIGAAFECAKKRVEGCLKRTNERLAKEVEAHLADDDFLYGCNNPCINSIAATLASSLGYKAQTNFNRNLLNLLTPDQACTTVLHELMHAAGAEKDNAHDDGTDRIYSCARYCAGCIDYGGRFGSANEPPFPPDNLDCVRCAEDPADKRRCGVKPVLKGGPCPTNNFCHAGLAGNAACQTCKYEGVEDCEGSPAPGELFNCCEMCPAPIDTSNDVPCPKPLIITNSCMTKPPECP